MYVLKYTFQKCGDREKVFLIKFVTLNSTTLDENATDTFIMELGAIPPNHEVNCEFSYFLELKEQTSHNARSDKTTKVKTFRYHIPMHWKIRYVPKESDAPELNHGPSQTFPFPVRAENSLCRRNPYFGEQS